MLKYILTAVGGVFIFIGGIDWAVGALVPHSRILIGAGAVAIAAAGFLYRWQKIPNLIEPK